MASTGLISPLSLRMQNIVISRSNLIKWKSMKWNTSSMVLWNVFKKAVLWFSIAPWTDLLTASTKKRLSSASSVSGCPWFKTLGSGYFYITLLSRVLVYDNVAPGFKNKTRYTPYVSPGSQISHIATNKGNIKRQCSIYNVLSIKDITLDNKSGTHPGFFQIFKK